MRQINKDAHNTCRHREKGLYVNITDHQGERMRKPKWETPKKKKKNLQ